MTKKHSTPKSKKKNAAAIDCVATTLPMLREAAVAALIVARKVNRVRLMLDNLVAVETGALDGRQKGGES
jgi:hypothetical protein